MNPAICGALAMVIAVGLGAFGAHGLKHSISADAMTWWETAVRYQAWHALGLVAIGLARDRADNGWLMRAAYALTLGIIMFSGSLYVMTLTGLKALGAITPLGGALFMIGWICFVLAFRTGASSHQIER